MQLTWRWLHRTLAPFVAVPLILTAITGVSYRWCRNVFGMEKESVKWLLQLHQGNFVNSTVAYTTMNMLSLVFMICSGFMMMRGFWTQGFTWTLPKSIREAHHKVSSFVFVLLALTGLTGWFYRWARNVWGMPKEEVSWLMKIHQGSYTPTSSVWYTLVTSSSLLFMACTGLVVWYRWSNQVSAREKGAKNEPEQKE